MLLVLYDLDTKRSNRVDVPQELRSRTVDDGTVAAPKPPISQHATADQLFANAAVNPSEYIADVGQILSLLLVANTDNPAFDDPVRASQLGEAWHPLEAARSVDLVRIVSRIEPSICPARPSIAESDRRSESSSSL